MVGRVKTIPVFLYRVSMILSRYFSATGELYRNLKEIVSNLRVNWVEWLLLNFSQPDFLMYVAYMHAFKSSSLVFHRHFLDLSR